VLLAAVNFRNMKKKLVLKNEQTGMYFTNDYECWWSRDISDAYKYDENENMETIFSCLLANDYDNPLDGVNYIELVVFYCR
jgi:hypothetical protein